MKVITVGSLKGGVGKTTCAVFLSQALAARGARVLAIDLDPCPHLTDFYLRKLPMKDLTEKNVRHVLMEVLSADEAIYHSTLGVDVMPATLHLNTVSVELHSDPGAMLRFHAAIEPLDYDYAVIDTCPYLSTETRAALYAANHVLVPIDLDRWTVQGYSVLRDEMKKVAKTTGTAAALNVVPFRVSENQAGILIGMEASWKPLKTVILRNAAIKNAANSGRALVRGTHSFEQFDSLAKEIEATK